VAGVHVPAAGTGKELLTEDGVIFVSIDDNEVFHLGLLMEQVFGAANFIANVIWQKVFSPKSTAQHFSDDHEYIVCFALNKTVWRPNPVPRSVAQDKAYKNPDKDPRGPWTSGDLSARNFYSKGTYPITCPSGRVVAGPPPGNYWRFSEERFLELDRDKRIWWGKDGDNIPRFKRFLTDVQKGVVPQTLWQYNEVGHTQDAKQEIHDILRFENTTDVFSTPKPVALMERIMRIATKPGDIVLDFFAGSGTTAQAVLNLNKEDGGNRRFILGVQHRGHGGNTGQKPCAATYAQNGCGVWLLATPPKRAKRLPGSVVVLPICAAPHPRSNGVSRHPARANMDGAAIDSRRGVVTLSVRIADADGARQTLGGDLFTQGVQRPVLEAVETALHGAGQAVVYSWQPALLAQRVTDPRVSFEPIPAFLVNRFGARSSAKGRTVMSAPAPKGYQREAVVNALEIFRYAESQFRQAGDDASRAAATAFNGCLLLEAPTGSGKTLMAGMIAESVCRTGPRWQRANSLVLVYTLRHSRGAGQRGDQVHVCRLARA
jgi:hypothetical protein